MVAEILVLLAAIAGTAWLLGMFGWLWYRLRALEERVGALGPGALASGEARAGEAGEGERELPELREAVAGLAERVDFLERLLEAGPEDSPQAGRIPAGGGPPDDRPGEPTGP